MASFFQQHGADQACAACLVLICDSCGSDNEIADLAVQAFFGYGSDIKAPTAAPAAGANITMPAFAGSPVQGGSSQGSFLSTPQVHGFQQTLPTPKPPKLLNSTTVAAPPSDKD